MAVTAIVNNSVMPPLVTLQGVYVGQQAPLTLGLAGLSKQIGGFYIGFDTRVKPAMVRIFFDPTGVQLPPTTTSIALVQTCCITYQGYPIPPSVYGMNSGYLDAYLPTDSPNLPDEYTRNFYACSWVDMMAPQEANRLSLPLPLFAWNGWLRNAQYQPQQFSTHPMPNGSFTQVVYPPQNLQLENGTSLTASLFDAINLDIDSPPQAVLTQSITDMIRIGASSVASGNYTQEQIESESALGLALALLGIPDQTQLASVEVVGPFMLITMIGTEEEGPMYAAFFDKSLATLTTEQLVIYNLDIEDFEEKRMANLTKTFSNLQQYLTYRGLVEAKGFPANFSRTPGARGGGGLNPFPFNIQGYGGSDQFYNRPQAWNENEIGPEMAFSFQTFAVCLTPEGNIAGCCGAIAWEVSRIFDPSTLEFRDLRIAEPSDGNAFYVDWFNQVVRGERAVRDTYPAALIDSFRQAVQSPKPTAPTELTLFEDTRATTAIPNNLGLGANTWVGGQ